MVRYEFLETSICCETHKSFSVFSLLCATKGSDLCSYFGGLNDDEQFSRDL